MKSSESMLGDINAEITKLQDSGAVVALLVRNESGTLLEVNADERVSPASLIKVFIAEAVHQLWLSGDALADPRRMIELSAVEPRPTSGTGILAGTQDLTQVSLRDLIFLNIAVSDVWAMNAIIRVLGTEQLELALKLAGYKKTLIRRESMDLEKLRSGVDNFTTVRECDRLLGNIFGSSADGEVRATIRDAMRWQQFKEKVASGLVHHFSGEPYFFHKTGEVRGMEADFGMLLDEKSGSKTFVAVVLNQLDDNQVGRMFMRRVGEWLRASSMA